MIEVNIIAVFDTTTRVIFYEGVFLHLTYKNIENCYDIPTE